MDGKPQIGLPRPDSGWISTIFTDFLKESLRKCMILGKIPAGRDLEFDFAEIPSTFFVCADKKASHLPYLAWVGLRIRLNSKQTAGLCWQAEWQTRSVKKNQPDEFCKKLGSPDEVSSKKTGGLPGKAWDVPPRP